MVSPSEGDDPARMHQQMAATLDRVIADIRAIQDRARSQGSTERPQWPMIVLRTPKGWTGPKEVDGHKTEGHWRSHQVPLANVRENAEHREALEAWLRGHARQGTYSGGFVEHWLQRLLYYDAPGWAFTTAYSLFALAVAAAWWACPPVHCRWQPRSAWAWAAAWPSPTAGATACPPW